MKIATCIMCIHESVRTHSTCCCTRVHCGRATAGCGSQRLHYDL